MPLNEQRILFAHEYVKTGFNATQAAKNAGYSEKCAFVIGHRLTEDPETWALIQKLTDNLLQESYLNAKAMLNLVSYRASFSIKDVQDEYGMYKPIDQWPEEAQRSVESIETYESFGGEGDQKHVNGLIRKVKFVNKDKNTEFMLKYHGLLKDRVEHSGAVNFTISSEEERI